MNDNAPKTEVYVRLAHADDDEFILSLARRFAEFELPPWRKRAETLAGIERDIEHHLRVLPPASHLRSSAISSATRCSTSMWCWTVPGWTSPGRSSGDRTIACG